MLINIAEAVVVAVILGVGGILYRVFSGRSKNHRNDHEQIKKLPEVFEEHSKVHSEISEQLTGLVCIHESNVVQMRTQLLQIHDRLMAGSPESKYWKQQFYELYTIYQEMGGNSFVEDLKRDIDDL